jgi:hypothetical protein
MDNDVEIMEKMAEREDAIADLMQQRNELLALLKRTLPFLQHIYQKGGVVGLENSADLMEQVSEGIQRHEIKID